MYCADVRDLTRLPLDFSLPAERVYADPPDLNRRIADLLLVDGQYFMDMRGLFSLTPNTFEPEQTASNPDGVPLYHLSYDPGTRCFFGLGGQTPYYYCEGDSPTELRRLTWRGNLSGMAMDTNHIYWSETKALARLPKPVLAE